MYLAAIFLLLQRKEKQLDKELLDITGQVLVNNPDIYTLWNIRRDTLNIFRYGTLLSIYRANQFNYLYCLRILHENLFMKTW